MNDNAELKNKSLVAENWCHTRITKVDQCSFMWTIHNYYAYHYHLKTPVQSSKFKSITNEECEWNLALYPPASNAITLCLLLHCDAPWRENVSVKCKMSVINDKNEETKIRKQIHFIKLIGGETTAEVLPHFSVPNFLTIDDFLNKNILPDDKLTIFCEFQFIIDNEPDFIKNDFGKSFVLEKNDPNCTLRDDLENLFADESHSDFVISVDGRNYSVHKGILAARSKVFAAMFQQDANEQMENCLEITDLREAVVIEMLRYIYTGRVNDLKNTAFELLQAADRYDLQHLKIMCQQEILKKLSVENVVNCLILADLYPAPLLKDQAIQFMKIRLMEVMKTESWAKFKASDVFDEAFKRFFA